MNQFRFSYFSSALVALISISGCCSHSDQKTAAIAMVTRPALTIESKKVFDLEALLKNSKDFEKVSIGKDPGYKQAATQYSAIRFSKILKESKVSSDKTLKFICSDGFEVSIPAEKVLNTSAKKAIAYLAVEDPKSPWPMIVSKKGSAGPFYLVWVKPELSQIPTDFWPFQITTIEVL